MAVTIHSIHEVPAYLEDVNSLGDANSDTLGHLPYAAWQEYAARNTILLAIDDVQGLVGYLLYRISPKGHAYTEQKATIVHLCVATTSRGEGVARALVKSLRELTRELRGIELKCRRDYEASRVWPRLGFSARKDVPGRGKNTTLTYWWLDHGHRTLFDEIFEAQADTKIHVAVDMNVFLDLTEPARQAPPESMALVADWLQDEIELCVTEEIRNEINRAQEATHRKRKQADVSGFHELKHLPSEYDKALARLRPLFPQHLDEQDESDLRHVAMAAASGIEYLVTRDNELLRLADRVQAACGLQLVRPSGLITRLDELGKASEYQPARLAGIVAIKERRVRTGDDEAFPDYFQQSHLGEKKAQFLRTVRGYLSRPDDCDVFVTDDKSGSPMALRVITQTSGAVDCTVFRVTRGPLADTLARYLTQDLVEITVARGNTVTVVSDPYLSENTASVLQEAGFIPTAHQWVKVSPCFVGTTRELAEVLNAHLEIFPNYRGVFVELLEAMDVASTIHEHARLERALWPAKLLDIGIPAFTVPIHARWAIDLFDRELANQTLLGANKEELALNWEGIYYRTNKPTSISSPARVLWYVTHDARFQGSKSIRACSYLDQVLIETPKELYRQFKRLGVYEWEHVYQLAGNNIAQAIMAFRFSKTELFSYPVPYAEFCQITKDRMGTKYPNVQSPSPISEDVFEEVYRRGMRLV